MATTVDIVVYGGGFAGVAAAAKAAANTASNKTIALIVPDPVPHDGRGSCLGGLGTIGGQNYFDIRPWNKTLPTQGTFNWWYKQHGHFYSTDAMAAQLKTDLAKYGSKIKYYYGYDIKSIGWRSPAHITEVRLCSIDRNQTSGIVQWGSLTDTVAGTVFIDASDSGRLTRLSNFGGTVGRYDFPAKYLDSDEKTGPGKGRQQVATLMFKIKGFDVSKIEAGNDEVLVSNNTTGCGGGGTAYRNKNGAIYRFNEKYGPQGFAIKPYNMAQDGPNSDEWWLNSLLVFNVDGRAYNRDKGTSVFPTDMRSDYRTVDDAWVAARNMINTAEFQTAIREFPGFQSATIVKDSKGLPVVGEVLYLRETIHSALSASSRANGTENTNYGLRSEDCNLAGATKTSGKDSRNYAKRIGLNFYWSDINGYKFEDLKDANGNYIWFNEVGDKVRPDLGVTKTSPTNPVYVPYGTLATNFVYNLLIPGYAAGMSSFAWAEARTLPNQCVLGDAAGVAAAYAVTNSKDPLNFSSSDISKIQTTLKNSDAKLEK